MTGDSPLLVHVVGARPNFPKMGPVWRALRDYQVQQQIVHTGQHYDDEMSAAFFRDLDLPWPDVNLEIGSGSQTVQTASIMVALERSFVTTAPDLVVVYGDVNSTLAASLVCAKLCLPVAHVEAGLRSGDNAMPEEVNRRVTDTLSDLLLATSPDAVDNLLAEGADTDHITLVGNPMIDSLLLALERVGFPESRPQQRSSEPYAVVTLHRPANVDTPEAANASVSMLRDLCNVIPVYLPLHPRGRRSLTAAGLRDVMNLRLLNPLPYLQFVQLVAGATVVVTDSGGIQEESTVLGVPCLTVRTTTERPITITHGTNRLVGMDKAAQLAAEVCSGHWVAPDARPPLWDGHAGERIAAALVDFVGGFGRE